MIDKNKLKDLPENPGVYLMKDENGKIIYIGKARNLKNRVRQYFNASEKTIKVATMVDHIADFELIITDTEMEALILECNLIKKNMPRFNILLKDDKTYPYIKVTTNEKYPRVILTREVKKDGAKYYGPFTNVYSVRQTVELLNKLYSLKRCSKKFKNGKVERPCLNYHIKECPGMCQGNVSVEKYNESIQEIIQILNGKYENIIHKLEKEMKEASQNLNFERAAKIRDQINGINHITEKQKIVSNSDEDQDIIGFYGEDFTYCIQVFFIRKGKILGRENFFFADIYNEQEFLSGFMKQFYHSTSFVPKEVIVQREVDDGDIIEEWLSKKRGSRVSLKVPQRGSKKDLIHMATDNARLALEDYKHKMTMNKVKQDMSYNWLMEKLSLKEKPNRIESYDISNISGSDSVGSMVVYEGLKPNKKAYRRFRIKSITGQNDYGSMQEVLFRRIERGVKELEIGQDGKFLPFPDIILLDGGLGHINAVKDILAHYPTINIPICGLVKDHRHKLRALIYEGETIEIPFSTPIYYLLNSISEEVHRFAITYHQKIRGDNMLASELNNIPGVGPVKRKALLKYFKSVDNIKKASTEELLQIDGINDKIARNIVQHFQ
ncbi:excinuclease ABC subunit C [Alkalibaculum bacchi]|uniref:UvrABC system protein C n=1 Tax=Alkalibaculum bacchi TaxID=645887 RepID=A0A366IF37_9FIRM|nr:excinuclease ABC subunit UvrC [Alkalibaculum bacchi]RBP69981.1 excinuclease ABC subunit C [Alkalibaculum bacchi]